MKVGIAASFGDSPLRDIGFLKEFAQAAETSGFNSLWAPEHIVFFNHYSDSYPHSPSGDNPWRNRFGLYDPLLVCTVAACVTTRLRLGTTVLIVPERPALLTAKEVMTLDHVAGGRFEFGVGLGWSSQEYAALGVPWKGRGRRFDEYLDAIRVAWSGETAEFHGEFVDFEDVVLQPRPLTNGGPPILVGGNSEFAMRRAAQRGDGWFGVWTPHDDAESLLARLQAALEKSGRGRRERFLVKLNVPFSPDNSDDQVFAMIQRAASLGLDELVVQAPIRSKHLAGDMRRWSAAVGLNG